MQILTTLKGVLFSRYSLVVVSCKAVLPQEYVGVAKVTVGSPPSPCVI